MWTIAYCVLVLRTCLVVPSLDRRLKDFQKKDEERRLNAQVCVLFVLPCCCL